MNNDQLLAYHIKIKFGTPPNEPTEQQLFFIKRDINLISAYSRHPTLDDWNRIVTKHCPNAGTYFYGGADNSDLSTLLQLASNK